MKNRILKNQVFLTLAYSLVVVCLEPWANISHAGAEGVFYESNFVVAAGSECPNVHSSTIIELADRSLLTAFWCASTEGALDGKIVLSRFEEVNDTWGPLITAADTPNRFDGNPVLFTFPDERILLLYSVRDPEAPGMVQVVTRASIDGGNTWSQPKDFFTPRGVRTRNHPIIMANGETLLPLYDHPSVEPLFVVTSDMGKSWKYAGRIVCTEGCAQPTVISRDDHSLYALMRTWSEDPEKRFLRQSESRDYGRTWSQAALSDIRSVNSAIEMITLMSGRVLLVFNDGEGRKRTPLNVALSEDGGRHWQFKKVLESGKGPYSYPSVVQSSNGIIHITYTYERVTIKHVQFNEAWIMNEEQ